MQHHFCLFTDLAPTPTPNREPVATHFTFDDVPHNLYNPKGIPSGNFANPEYFETDSNESSDSLNKSRSNRRTNQNQRQKADYYNEINELRSDGGSTRGSTAESTISM